MTNDDVFKMDEKRKARRDETDEVFTPNALLDIMCNKISPELWSNPNKNFLDNCCGNGQIILYIIKKKINSGLSYINALSTTYGIDIMEDNIIECKERIFKLLNELNISYNEQEVFNIINQNIVCHDAFDWDYENWKPLPKSVALF